MYIIEQEVIMDIFKAASKGNVFQLKLMLITGKNINERNKKGNTPLLEAICDSQNKTVQFLIDKKADIHIRDNDGETALIKAARTKNIHIVRFLIDHGAKINEYTKYGGGPLQEAVWRGNFDIVKLLVQNGAEINKTGDFGRTPLSIACIYGFSEIVTYLLDNGADCNIADKEGYTPLIHAAKCLNAGFDFDKKEIKHPDKIPVYIEIMKLLLSGGANINAHDKTNQSALNAAALCNFYDVVNLLIDNRIDLSDKSAKEALYVASFSGFIEIASLLYKRGVRHPCALDIARKHGYDKVVKIFSSIDGKEKESVLNMAPDEETIKLAVKPLVTDDILKINLVDSCQLAKSGKGSESFDRAIQKLNAENYNEAISAFLEALKQGTDDLRQGYIYANLGEISLLHFEKVDESVEYFLKVLNYKNALYESIHTSVQYLIIIFTARGRKNEAELLSSLCSRTQQHLGYSLNPATADKIRRIVEK